MSETDEEGGLFDNDITLVLAVLGAIYLVYIGFGVALGYSPRGQISSLGNLTFFIAVFAMAALALNLHWGYTGLFNIGIVGFMAVGVYFAGIVSKPALGAASGAAGVGGFGLPLWLGVIVGMCAAGAVGALTALPALRLRADYLAIVTVALSEIIRFSLLSEEFSAVGVGGYTVGLGGGDGVILDYGDPLELFIKALSAPFDLITGQQGFLWDQLYIGGIVEPAAGIIGKNPKPVVDTIAYSLLLLAFTILLYVLLDRIGSSPFGRVLRAIREDEDAAKALGKNTDAFKIKSFVVGCALMGLVGFLWFGSQGSVTPNTFRPRITFFVWIAVIIGGAGSNTGSVLGGAIFAGVLFQGPLYLKNVVFSFLNNPTAPSGFGPAVAPLSNGEIFPFILYTLDSLRQLQPVIMGVVLIVLMHRRPQGLLGHRKDPASAISINRSVATDGGETDE